MDASYGTAEAGPGAHYLTLEYKGETHRQTLEIRAVPLLDKK